LSLSARSICLRSGCESARSTLETSSELALAIFKTFIDVSWAFYVKLSSVKIE
jgi:hypothetical protein